MSSITTTAVFAIAALIYLLSGGRWSIALLGLTLFLILPNISTPQSEHKELKPSKDHKSENKQEIDFTNTFKEQKTTTGAVLLNRPPKSLSESKSKTLKPFKRLPKVVKANKESILRKKANTKTRSVSPVYTSNATPLLDSNFLIFYSSLTGASERSAKKIHESLVELDLKNKPQLINMDDDIDDLDNYFIQTPDLPNLVYIMVLPSYDTDSPLDYFLEFLDDTANDFRIDKYPLRKLTGFSVLGLGDTESWPNKFCYQAKMTDRLMGKLGARRIFPLGEVCMKSEGDSKVEEWNKMLIETLKDNEPIMFEDQESYENEEEEEAGEGDSNLSDEGTLVDVEDMGKMISDSKTESTTRDVKKMVTKDSPTYKSLTKQGYTVVGSHSGVKICRWTKSALRGRGSCYKFAFYGIRSHLCMEATPSLSCSNKCVFCWRHGTNPVGTTWRWEVDEPEVILEGALEGHYKKIKQMRGVPGVSADRFNEAFTVRHCALSLVGEPIFYPHINKFLQMLHAKHISSFLVCNAQHPDQLRALNKVTQLYVSIDAPTKEELKVVDRPLFRDYWERLNSCLDILRTVQSHQRTVFRLTLVKGFNMSDAKSYADLVAKGLPSLIEIKGATFCGSSSGGWNMA
ncbi:unnamed protein product [Ambrosiozyma monospora]|uniref:tRNA 4-demethylwyosine synthase (AdoMet-dependent) n=1 Tax=Ambrosiozyma monospora TaxID=43982 RepID=A0A9W7DFM4_AMBMO|nr:unnamed protein product [Ambrosiozyma monospora]